MAAPNGDPYGSSMLRPLMQLPIQRNPSAAAYLDRYCSSLFGPYCSSLLKLIVIKHFISVLRLLLQLPIETHIAAAK